MIESYNVYFDKVCVAKDMDLEHALLLVKAMFRDDVNIHLDDMNVRIERTFRPFTKEEVDDWT